MRPDQDAPSPPPEATGQAGEKVRELQQVGEELVRETDWTAVFGTWQFKLMAALAASLLLMWAWRKVRRFIRRRRGARLNPLLAKYGGEPDPREAKLAAARRAEAEHIVATSSTAAVAGYQIIEQIEAVFVDGFRRPEEAVEGLKAAAAMKGANAVVNVRQERSAAGRCIASGDAVVVKRIATTERTAATDRTAVTGRTAVAETRPMPSPNRPNHEAPQPPSDPTSGNSSLPGGQCA